MPRCSGVFCRVGALLWLSSLAIPARATVLWSDPAARAVHNTGTGVDILGGAVKRTATNSDALYFRFHVEPISDATTEPYFAGFQLFEGDEERLGVGNALAAWGYSAFNTAETGPSNAPASGEFNLKSAHPEPFRLGLSWPYELVRHGVERTIIFKVQYVPGGDDLVTVWLNPNLERGATDKNQPENLTTKFKAKATFNQIRLRQGPGPNADGGNGWIFSDMAIATSFNDFVMVRFWQTWWFNTLVAVVLLVGVGTTVRLVEKRKYQLQLRRAEQESALERERARIAQDLHDDLGSSLTRLSLLSGLIKADKDNPEQVEAHAGKLAESADQTVRALEEIVWAVRPGSDTLQSLVEYIAHFANELFEGNTTRCRLDLPHDLPARPLPPDVRHNIFLIVKEALTNALKHAGAGEVRVLAKMSANTLEISVQDEGKGFDPASPAEGRRNGLGNMRRRAEAIGGRLELQSAPGIGTTVRLVVILKNGMPHGPAK
ncbi:MAG TPA: sensor histidine kinase [Verrucomicrobiae bacterium]|nr:sensor histidine kinase [Verrucomicrobiae bacterium]